MSAIAPDDFILVSTVVDIPRISDAERAELLRSLEESRAEYAAGRYYVLKRGMLVREFEAIRDEDATDDALDALSGITTSASI